MLELYLLALMGILVTGMVGQEYIDKIDERKLKKMFED